MNKKIAVIGGSGLFALELFQGLEACHLATIYGKVKVTCGAELLFLQRHGEPPRPPHRINHHANLKALHDWGADYIVAVNSTGSLRRELEPGTLLVPDDYFNPWAIKTFHDEELVFATPGLSQTVRRALLAAAAELEVAVVDGGVYIQTTGPRFETRAEVRVLAGWGSLVGMTMASEATLACELGLPYASLCVIDNYANGICAQVVDFKDIEKEQRRNAQLLARLLPVAIGQLQRSLV
ncbi:MAG TPA: 6-oxopurine nucleoside phosphorylase [Proteobacteria bacterium]|mgnify:CR=1 FL=1|nr:6-oxopurine nucleoside phosphorylase [Pseudomonadota bacterium]